MEANREPPVPRLMREGQEEAVGQQSGGGGRGYQDENHEGVEDGITGEWPQYTRPLVPRGNPVLLPLDAQTKESFRNMLISLEEEPSDPLTQRESTGSSTNTRLSEEVTSGINSFIYLHVHYPCATL